MTIQYTKYYTKFVGRIDPDDPSLGITVRLGPENPGKDGATPASGPRPVDLVLTDADALWLTLALFTTLGPASLQAFMLRLADRLTRNSIGA